MPHWTQLGYDDLAQNLYDQGLYANAESLLRKQDEKTQVGWLSGLTGGKTEAERELALAEWQNKWTAEQAELERKYGSAEALKQRQWEEYMSNTAYSRAMADMKSAGLNPALMYARGGMSASTPSGASGSRGTSPRSATVGSPTNNAGALAGIIGAVAYSSARAVTLANATGKVKAAMGSYKVGSGQKALQNFYNFAGI